MSVSNKVDYLNFTMAECWQKCLIGDSTLHRPIYLFHNASVLTEQLHFDTFIFAGIHGDEPESIHLAEAFLKQNVDKEKLVGVIPCLNPDGYFAQTRGNANGIDLNRNFPTQNWQIEATDPNYLPGPSPASETETKLLIEVVEKFKPQKIISIHTPYRVINYDGPALALAEVMASNNYYPIESDIGYETPGSFGTWAGYENDIAVITLELPEKEAFTNNEQLNNLDAIVAAINY